jgi:hypothetical protein
VLFLALYFYLTKKADLISVWVELLFELWFAEEDEEEVDELDGEDEEDELDELDDEEEEEELSDYCCFSSTYILKV